MQGRAPRTCGCVVAGGMLRTAIHSAHDSPEDWATLGSLDSSLQAGHSEKGEGVVLNHCHFLDLDTSRSTSQRMSLPD